MSKKLSEETKVKLIYSGELILFSIVFAIIATLKLTKVIGYSETRAKVFTYITLVGVAWAFTDFIWGIASKRRRERICLVDKISVLPLSIFMLVFDIINIAKNPGENFYVIMLSSALYYAAALYIFQGIYHWFNPLKELLEDLEEEEKEDKEK